MRIPILSRLIGRRDTEEEKMDDASHQSAIQKIDKDTATLRDIRESIAAAKSQVRETVPPDAENGRHD